MIQQEKEMATNSRILAWRIPWTEEPGGLQFMGSQRVRHNCATNTHTHTHTHDPAIPLLSIYPQKIITQKGTCTPVFIVTIFTIARTWKQPKCPSTKEWIKKIWYIYPVEKYSAI